MPILVACVGCGAQLRVRDEYLGKAIKCPQCGQVLQAELPPEARVETAEQLPAGQAADDEAAEEQPRRRRKSRYVRCPNCGAKRPERVLWTFWGSFYGPALLSHVRCTQCGTAYNGRTGGSNLIPAILFVMVPVILIIVIGVAGWWLLQKRGYFRSEISGPAVHAELNPRLNWDRNPMQMTPS